MTQIVVDVGSACDPRVYDVVAVQLHRVVPLVLNAYGVACNHAHPVSDHVANKEPADHSFHELLLNNTVGAVMSFRIMNVFELVVHQMSDILMMTFVVPALGVNENDRLFELSVQVDHPLVEYATAVLGVQLDVSLILHVVLSG